MIQYRRIFGDDDLTDLPVSLADACRHLRLIVSDADIDTLEQTEKDYVTGLIQAAALYCESYTRRQLVPATWAAYIDKWPRRCWLELNKSPLISIDSIKYWDESGKEQTLDPGCYYSDLASEPGRIKFTELEPIQDRPNAITINFKAGYADTSGKYDITNVPMVFRPAILLIVGHLYEHREQVLVGVQQSEIDFGVERLLDPVRVFTF